MKNRGKITSDFQRVLADLRERGILRKETVLSSPRAGSIIIAGGRELINLSSNDYLGLASHPEVIEAACRAARQWGSGAGSSRMICGSTRLHVELEEKLGDFLDVPSCLIFGSGYLANAGILGALTSGEDTIFSDRLNHASIVDGCRLSKARTRLYDHASHGHLRSLIQEETEREAGKIIVTETTFSMEGDEAPLEHIAEIARDSGAFLVVDEAHSIGIKGPGGRGLASLLPKDRRPDIVMGTFGKALGVYGAFAATSVEVRKLLVSRCRTLLYSTAPPPAVMAAVKRSLEIVSGNEGEALRKKLFRNCRLMKEAAQQSGWEGAASEGPIFILKAGSAGRAVEAEEKLLSEGIFLKAIRYPTVAEGTERLRIVVNSQLTEEQIEKIAGGLRRART